MQGDELGDLATFEEENPGVTVGADQGDTHGMATMLGSVIRKLRSRKGEADEAFVGVLEKKREEARAAGVTTKMQKPVMEEVKWFICKGNGPNVPKFLQGTGKVRNRNMPKNECEGLIEEFWQAKAAHDSHPKAQN